MAEELLGFGSPGHQVTMATQAATHANGLPSLDSPHDLAHGDVLKHS